LRVNKLNNHNGLLTSYLQACSAYFLCNLYSRS